MSPLASYLVETGVTLLAVVALAVLVLVGARRWGWGRPSGPMTLVGRLPLDARRSVYLVRVGKRVLVLGASEAGLTRLGQLRADEVAAMNDAPSPAFSAVFAKLRDASRAEPARARAEKAQDGVVEAEEQR